MKYEVSIKEQFGKDIIFHHAVYISGFYRTVNSLPLPFSMYPGTIT